EAEVPALLDVKVEGSEVTLELSQLVPYDVFTLDAPSRLVVEIPGTIYKAGFNKKTVNGSLVRRIRGYQFKENPLVSRVVLDLKAPVDYKSSADNNKVIIALTKNQLLAQKTETRAERPKSSPVRG